MAGHPVRLSWCLLVKLIGQLAGWTDQQSPAGKLVKLVKMVGWPTSKTDQVRLVSKSKAKLIIVSLPYEEEKAG